MNKLVKAIPYSSLNIEFLRSLNGILQLTDRELELLSVIIEFDINYDKKSGENKNVVSRSNRKLIRGKLGITPENLSRYISKLKRLGYLQQGKAEDEVMVNKALIPEIIKDRVQVTIILNIKDE